MIYSSIIDTVGKTPLIKLSRFCTDGNLYAKAEKFNPAGSVKDRAALYMIEDAERRGILKEGGIIIEPTSGNTGIGLAAIAAVKGYKVILTMPESMSAERRQLLAAYGAEIVLTDASRGMQGAVEKAEELQRQYEGSIIAGQFSNPANPLAHYETTAPEIWEDLDGKVDIFVAGVGTGGTISGIGRFLKERNPDVKIVAVEPSDSPLLSEGRAGAHKIQGIGANFLPEALDMSVIDGIVTVTADEAYEAVRELAKCEGLLVGISSGAAAFAASVIAMENRDKNVVVLLPDTGERYLSSGVF